MKYYYEVATTEYKYVCGHGESHNCLYCLIAIKNVWVPFAWDASRNLSPVFTRAVTCPLSLPGP
jgi:hypothetical protein